MNPSGSEESQLTQEKSNKSYTYDGVKGWRGYRILRPCRGMYHYIRCRLPYYATDITDAFTYRTVASIIWMYFVKSLANTRPLMSITYTNIFSLLPALAYTLDMTRRTGYFYGVNEALFVSALAAMVFSLLSAQPLTIVGITGLISLFNYTIYDIISVYDIALYPRFMAWTGIWAAIFHWLVAGFNACDNMRYVTDFSSESFGLEWKSSSTSSPTPGTPQGYLSCLIAILYFGSVYGLEKLGASILWKPWFRGILSDYAYVLTTLFWVGFSHIPGNLQNTDISQIPTGAPFHPTQPRSWLLDFWNLEIKWVFVALPFGFLVMLLFYYDHNVSSITAQARQFPLRKPGGFHWDFFLLGCPTFVSGILGLPLPNGLVPQAPVHTDSLTVYETRVKIIPTVEGEQTEIRRPVTGATAVVEQRVAHFVMGLALIESNGIVQKLIYLSIEKRFIQRDDPLLSGSRLKTIAYISLQLFGVAITVAIFQSIAAIGFPVLIILLIPLRAVLMPKWDTLHELQVLDDLTASNEVVLASLGGAPVMAEHTRRGIGGWRGGGARRGMGCIDRELEALLVEQQALEAWL
ncbi:Uu.00g050110.m01.CDS01 [Anthostomella pinea]|uniref:Uu.00g050110.m01.CDS01 n=1 Tax=Anthostomella pinea TaxID=933095 RepID=A0AAI8YMH4_9PEZI|nr:Uu.00g050110.m01.CDS01 [Anthostomella pinea]